VKGVYFILRQNLDTISSNKVKNENKTTSLIKEENEMPLILIVEDNEINMQIVKSFLDIKGMNYLCANNGREAIEILEDKFVDLILMDIQMPQLNGYETTKIIRKIEGNIEKHTPIIAMTAYAMTMDKKKCIENGMDGHISKPFNLEELNKVITKYIL
jgi:CheY-like chemotaxis protein